MGKQVFFLPDLGEGLTEADLVSWSVAVGDRVELNQTIAEVETAKALVELPSPFAGTVTQLLAEPGSTVAVGTPVIAIDTPTGTGTDADSPGQNDDASGGAPVLVGSGPLPPRPSRRRHLQSATVPRNGLSGSATTTPAAQLHPAAKPSTRKLARDLGVDLTVVDGTGPDGLVTDDDVRAVAKTSGAVPDAVVPDRVTPERETRTPIRGVRKHTADAVTRSAFTAPHVTEFLTVDVTAAVELLRDLRDTPSYAGLHATPLALVARVLLLALRAHPELNATWDGERCEIVTKHYVNLGIAVAGPRGLTVPNIKDAHLLGLRELCRELDDLAETARSGRTTPAALSGGTVTITNVGVFGVDAGTPILTPGEAAILCLGAIRQRPWVHRGELAVRSVTTLGLSFDHRLVDGEQGSRLLADIGAMLENPLRLADPDC
ncbi:dihydrolipoamide acetyltransferase family protein [Speluncibacter jeojiensis]|uniref:Dihydrolipoamide acetyltransferase component of pyruvate dehydrogenase complex n=1 Tax=Speluncibacter jeojiensis TaxID=2710754 RepID=A0A9X4M1B3_9ACTN|nr:2-oxo acid dehydrogenase subunit E2 [Corynebacteriales bacterium D3-21]